MKKTLIIIIIFTSVISLKAQIPNAGFENWTTTGSYMNPDGWTSLNQSTASSGVFTCEKNTAHTEGSFSLKLTSKSITGVGIIPGIAVSGVMNQANFKPISGFPCSIRPMALGGSWQFMSYATPDTGSIRIALTRWNTATHSRDTICNTKFLLPGMVMSWTHFSITLNYLTNDIPDSANIILSSSNNHPAINSYLIVDDLGFSGYNGLDEVDKNDDFKVFPNPTSSKITIETSDNLNGNATIQLIDQNGKILNSEAIKLDPSQKSFDYQHNISKPGLYYLRIATATRTLTRKIVIR